MIYKNLKTLGSILVLSSLLVFSGCGSDDSQFTSDDNSNNLTGNVAKGPIKAATVRVYRLDTNVSLGSTTTDVNGDYSLDIGDYSGAVDVVVSGGTYIDEISGVEQDSETMTLEAISSVTPSDRVVNVTPITDIASRQLKSSELNVSNLSSKLDKITEVNKKVAYAVIGSEFDVTKTKPKILDRTGTDKITSSDGDAGKYGLVLAAFAKVTSSSVGNVESKITEIFNDIKDDGVLDDTIAGDLQTALSDSSITSGSDSSVTSEFNSSIESMSSFDTNATVAGTTSVTNQKRSSITTFILDIADINTSIPVKINSANTTLKVSDDSGSTYSEKGYVKNNSKVKVTLTNDNEYNTSTRVVLQVGENNITLSSTSNIKPTTTLGGEQIFVKNQSSEYNITSFFSDADTGSSLTYSIANGTLQSGLSLNSTTGVISGAATIEDSTGTIITVRATDEHGDFVEGNFTSIVLSKPVVSSISAPANTRLKNGDSVDLNVTFSEEVNPLTTGPLTITLSDGSTATASVTADTPFSSINAAYTATTGDSSGLTISSFSGATDLNGTTTGQLFLHTNVGQNVANLTIDNTAPTNSVTSGTNTENTKTVSYTPSITDADPNIVFSKSGTDAGSFDINSSTGVLTFQANTDYETKNSYSLNVIATDSAGNAGTTAVTISVANVVDNVPVLVGQSVNLDETATSGTTVATIATNGANGDANTTTSFAIASGNDGNFTISNSGVVTTTTGNLDFGATSSYSLKITATNEAGTSAQVDLNITINNINEITVTNDNKTVDEDSGANTFSLASLILNDTNSDETALSIVEVENPTASSKGSVSISGGDITYTPNDNSFGSDSFSYTVTNGEDNETGTINVTITSINDAPTLNGTIADKTAIQDVNLSYNIFGYFEDLNDSSDTLSYSATNLPSWANIDSTTGMISGMPSVSDLDPTGVTVTVRATDDGTNPNSLYVEGSFTLKTVAGLVLTSMDSNVTAAKANDVVGITLHFSKDANISITDMNDFNISFDINGTEVNATTPSYSANNTRDYNISLTIPSDTNLNDTTITIAGLSVGSGKVIDANTSSDIYTGDITATFTDFKVDNIKPTLTNENFNGQTTFNTLDDNTTVNLTFSEAVNILESNIKPQNGSVVSGSLSGSGTQNITFTLKANSSVQATAQKVLYTGLTDKAGNIINDVNGSNAYAMDTLEPTASVTTQPVNLNDTTTTTTVVFTFNENIDTSTITIDDFSTTGAGTLALDSVTATTATVTYTSVDGTNDATNTITLGDAYTDANGNAGTGVATANFAVDRANPTASVTTQPVNLNDTTTTTTVVFTFNENIDTSTITIDDFSTTGAGTLALDSVTATTATVTYTSVDGTNDATNTITLGDAYTDANGNAGTGVATANFAVDRANPTVTITDDEPGIALIAGGDVVFTFIFSEAVTGFDASGVVVTGGTKGILSGSGTTYTLPVTPNSESLANITVDVPANVAIDTNGNQNEAATQAIQAVNTNIPNIEYANSSPYHNEANVTIVSPAGDIVINFDENNITTVASKNIILVDKGSINDDSETNKTINTTTHSSAFSITGNDDNITIDLSDVGGAHLNYGHEYYITIDNETFINSVNNKSTDTGGDGTWNFTIESGTGSCNNDCLDNCDNL
jgi:hypothetical protein